MTFDVILLDRDGDRARVTTKLITDELPRRIYDADNHQWFIFAGQDQHGRHVFREQVRSAA